MDFEILKDCGGLDSIDSELLTGPMIGSIMIQQEPKDKEVTYKSILKSIHSFKQTENYLKIRESIIVTKTLENKIVSVEAFLEDRKLLAKAGMEESELNDFEIFIRERDSEKMTYKEAFKLYTDFKKISEPPIPEKAEFATLQDIGGALEAGKKTGKKVLLFFSAYASVGSRKMEDGILRDEEIKKLLSQKFISFVAYADDHTEDKSSGTTVGKNYIKLQEDYFKSSFQPEFYILDVKGKVISKFGLSTKTDEFKDFLNKGLD